MLNWITSIPKMIFDFLKKVFGWVDEGSRKRRASDLDHEVLANCINPPSMKKLCCRHNNLHNYRDVVEIEDNDDDVQICDETSYTQTYAHSRRLNYVNNSSKKRIPRIYHNSHKNSTHRIKNTNYNTSNMGSFMGKSRLNSRSSSDTQFSTLNKTNQLQDKQKYSQLLEKFLAPRIQVIEPTPRTRERPLKPVEVIDIEYFEPSTSARRTSEVFQTPVSNTPTRWFTPMSRPSSFRREKQQIEEIQIDDDDSSTKSVLSEDEKSRAKSNKLGGSRSEVPARNTLRDKLAVSEVMKNNYISRITEHHNERMEQRYKEAEELKRMTTVLAKHNRLQREAALEVQLNRSMRLCEAVLEEADDLEEPSLPELSSDMLQVVQHALIPHPKDEVLADSFGLRVTRKDIHTLAGLNWLNDEVINFYMNLLIQRGNQDKFLNVHAMNTFFYPKLLSGGHSSLKRWTRKIDIFAKDIVVVPVHLGVHWCMSIIDFRDKSIRYYDSMGGQNPKCLSSLRKYLEDESLDKKKKTYDTSDWTLESMRDIPQQMNGSDCGVFSCTFAEYICANREITFSQDDMPYFRNKMVYEILNVQIL